MSKPNFPDCRLVLEALFKIETSYDVNEVTVDKYKSWLDTKNNGEGFILPKDVLEYQKFKVTAKFLTEEERKKFYQKRHRSSEEYKAKQREASAKKWEGLPLLKPGQPQIPDDQASPETLACRKYRQSEKWKAYNREYQRAYRARNIEKYRERSRKSQEKRKQRLEEFKNGEGTSS